MNQGAVSTGGLYQRVLSLDLVKKLSCFLLEVLSDLGLFRNYTSVKEVSELLFQVYEHFMKALYDLIFIEITS